MSQDTTNRSNDPLERSALNDPITRLPLPLVVAELVAVVVRRHDVREQDVLGFGVHSRHLDLVAGEHPPVVEIIWLRMRGVDDGNSGMISLLPPPAFSTLSFQTVMTSVNTNHLITWFEDCLSRIKLLD